MFFEISAHYINQIVIANTMVNIIFLEEKKGLTLFISSGLL
jgi:hypothetical protein